MRPLFHWMIVALVLSTSAVCALRPDVAVEATPNAAPRRGHSFPAYHVPYATAQAEPLEVDLRGLASMFVAPADTAARARANASPAFVEGIADALAEVDPAGMHPEWERELWRICWRESKCGLYGPVGVHAIDRWTGERAYAHAVKRGRLDPEECPAHRLDARRPVGAFATRGGFGTNAARGVGLLGECVGPEALDQPAQAARVAARMIAQCTQDGRACPCSEHVALWAGAGRFAARPLFAREGKARYTTVAVQCGAAAARAYAVSEIMQAPLVGLRRFARAIIR